MNISEYHCTATVLTMYIATVCRFYNTYLISIHTYQQHCYGFSSNIIQLVSLKLNVANHSSMLHEHFHLVCTYLDYNIIMATTAILYCYKKCFPKAQLDKYEQFYFMYIYRHTYKIATLL